MKMLYRKSPYLYVFYIVTSFLILQILIVLWEKFNEFVWSRSPVIIYWPPVDGNIQCYGEIATDALLSVEDPNFSPKSKSIFFHETSCRGGIDSRQACAVEAAARAHPDWEVYLLFTAPVTDVMLKKSCLVKLLQFPNIKIARIHVKGYCTNTIVQTLVNRRLKQSLQAVQHTADIMKMLTLNKWGGVSVDLDVLVMRSFNDLPNNWIAKESPFLLASGVMRFSKDEVGQNLTKAVLREMASTYNSESWFFNGALAIERVLQRRCRRALKRTGDCKGLSIFGQEKFYPIPLSNAHLLVKEGPGPLAQVTGQPYTYCIWNILTNSHKVDQNSGYVRMAKKVCPTIYEMFGDEFGV